MATQIGGIDIIFGDERQPKALPLSHPKARWGEFGTETRVLPKGYVRRKGCLPLPCDIRFERDVPVHLRDGTVVYVDVYRPTTDGDLTCPAIIAWSPYGKQGGRGNQVLDDFPFRMAVPLSKLSELQKWEGPDPAYWVKYGYAVVNADPRGVGKSGGDIYQFGTQEGRDGADVVEWVGSRPWCSGKVALSGNSYLAISQWFIAAERPRYLAAIAPWEGISDLYGEGMALGGVITKSALSFNLKLLQVNAGENSWENTVEMCLQHKLFGAYHDDKRAKVENIEVPAYVVASWSNPIHTYGTFSAYGRLKSEKWLRVHDTWEWPDYYDEENRTDLHRFFDYFLKGIDNGWKSTPRFRAKIIDTAQHLPKLGKDYQAIAFPPPNIAPLKLFFDGEASVLSPTYPPLSTASYEAKRGGIDFTYTFMQETVLCGPMHMSLNLALRGSDDTDVFVEMEKILTNGGVGNQLKIPYREFFAPSAIRLVNYLGLVPETKVLFYKGPAGRVRLSRRVPAEVAGIPGLPIQSMKEYNPVKEGEVVQVDVPLAPIGMIFHKGEKLRVRLSGTDFAVFPPVDQATLEVEHVEDVNRDVSVTLHCGHDTMRGSCLVLPVCQA